MANNTYKQHLENLLKQDDRFVDDEGELMGNKVKSFTDDLDEKLIELLLQDEASREQFFIKIKEVYVFKASEFKFFLEQNKIDNSFTNYINQIGLSVGGKFIKDNTDVVLDFPYKDCILEGGQSTEEGLDTYFEYDEEVSKTDAKKGYKPQQYNEKQTKRKEIFFNTIVAKDEIDRLLEPKAFTSITKYDANGESKPKSFTRDAAINKKRGLPADTITDNLIIKGNNLLALESLKEEFKGKIKLIYIDPPYNTNGDSFAYNDSFNHSTWLTFMKNRFENAIKLLSENGVIFVQIDYIEQAYLKILMDDIFGVKQSLPEISIKTSTPAGFKVINPGLVNVSESILIFTKGNKKEALKKGYVKAGYQKDYNKVITNRNEPSEDWVIKSISDVAIENLGFMSLKDLENKYDKKTARNLLNNEIENFALENAESVFATYGPHKPSSRMKEGIAESKKHPNRIIEVPSENESNHYLKKGRLLAFYSSKLQDIDGEIMPTQRLSDFWDDLSWDSLANEGGVTLKNGKKPEALLKRIIEIATDEEDIVMDYHLGSGTTAAVAHKMGRQYIGIEQLDYKENDSTNRLKNVIDGDSTGISKIVSWQGGGSFTYLELAKNNQNAKDKILACNGYEELMELFNDLYSNYFLHYNLKIKEFKEVVAKEEKFIALPLEKQKEVFCKMLDNNQLYVNVSEMEDSKHNISPEDIALTKDFYQIKE